MSDFNPLVLRRILALRRFAIVADAELAELATLAENVVETRFPAGALIAQADSRLPALHLVLEGAIESAGMTWGPQQVFGALEVLADRVLAAPAVAKTETRTLQLFASDVAEFLEDSFGVLRTTLRTLATQLLAHGSAATPLPKHERRVVTQPLGLVERLVLLRQQSLFAGARLEALATLAHASAEVHWSAGEVVTRAGELAQSALVIVEGSLEAAAGDGAAHTLGPGDTIGGLEMLAEAAHKETAQATCAGRGLRCTSAAIFDVIEDHADFGLAMIATFAATLLDGSFGRDEATSARAS